MYLHIYVFRICTYIYIYMSPESGLAAVCPREQTQNPVLYIYTHTTWHTMLSAIHTRQHWRSQSILVLLLGSSGLCRRARFFIHCMCVRRDVVESTFRTTHARLCIYIYIRICIQMCTCPFIYLYIYMYIHVFGVFCNRCPHLKSTFSMNVYDYARVLAERPSQRCS